MAHSVLLLALATLLIAPSAHAAESYPEKPLRFIVPFPPGGGTDGLARILGAKLTEFWNQQVIIDNRAGAQGSVGTAAGAKAVPDGYTITLAHSGSLAINPHLYSNTGYDTLKDFAAVSGGVNMPFLLIVHPSVPATTMKELAALARQNPGKLTFASTSAGPWVVGELFKLTTKTQMLHVPYKGGGPAVIDLLTGYVTIMFSVPFASVPHVKAGKLRPITILGAQRIEAMPDVPTANEAGYPELGNVNEWYGVVAPSATPPEIVGRLNAAVVKALNAPDVLKRIASLGQYPQPTTPAEFAQIIKSDYERWGKVVKQADIKVE
jgi:tripartite-type tricarboxylate transporter receptor subunit TctC